MSSSEFWIFKTEKNVTYAYNNEKNICKNNMENQLMKSYKWLVIHLYICINKQDHITNWIKFSSLANAWLIEETRSN